MILTMYHNRSRYLMISQSSINLPQQTVGIEQDYQ